MSISRFSLKSLCNIELFIHYGLKNEPFILDSTFTNDWDAILLWRQKNGQPNLEYLIENYGNFFNF